MGGVHDTGEGGTGLAFAYEVLSRKTSTAGRSGSGFTGPGWMRVEGAAGDGEDGFAAAAPLFRAIIPYRAQLKQVRESESARYHARAGGLG